LADAIDNYRTIQPTTAGRHDSQQTIVSKMNPPAGYLRTP
jgi:hypothetical protein